MTIAVFRAIKLGDLLCAVPAFRALRRAYPDAHIALISLPWAAEFVARYPAYFDEFIPFPGWPGLPEQPLDPAKTVTFLADMQARQWDLVVQMQGNGTLVNAMLALFGAKKVIGYYPENHPEQHVPAGATLMPYPQAEHEVVRHVRMLHVAGIPAQGYDLEFPVTEVDKAKLGALPALANVVPGGYVCLHAGGISGRRWPERQFARIGDALAERGFTVVLTGTAAETPIIETVEELMRHPAVSVAGQTDLGSLAALLRGSALLVSNDTGVSHLAAACHVPSVVIFTSADPAEWAPLDRDRHRVVLESDATDPARVLAEIDDVLKNYSPAVV